VPGDYRELVRERSPGAFVSGPVERTDGTVIGTHAGIGGLTVGQRSGVGVATGERLYVLRLEPQRGAAVVGTKEEIRATRYSLADVRFVAGAPPAQQFTTSVVLRYRGIPLAATVTMLGSDASLELGAAALVAPGQAAVFYAGDEVIGGGVVARPAP